MKPDGRSLDIVLIGLGQAGGNIATEFFRRGYRALALNTAESDLTSLDPGGIYPPLPAEHRLYIGIDGYDGAGADPAYGSECILEHAEPIREAVLREAEDADAIILAAGLGGGTGSSLSALITVLSELELPLIGLMTLPSDGESGIIKVNAVRAINELVDAQLSGWIFIDNARLAELNQDISIVDYYAHINGRIASPIDGLNRLNNRTDIRSIRSFDGEDLRKLILSGGVLNYGVVELPTLSEDSVIAALKTGLSTSDLMPAGFEIGSVSYLGMVIEAPEAALAHTPISSFEHMDEQIKRETGGAAVYRGLYRSNDAGRAATLRFMAACQSLPHRIREILTDARKEGLAIRDKLQIELPTLELGEIERIELFRPGAKNRASERPKKHHRSQTPGPGIEDLRVDIMRPSRPAQSPQIKRQAKIMRATSQLAPPDNGARPSNAAERPVPALPSPAPALPSAAPPSAALRRSKPPSSARLSASPAAPPAAAPPTSQPARPAPAAAGHLASISHPPRPAPAARKPASPLDVPVSPLSEEPSHEMITHEIDLEQQMQKQREGKLMPTIEEIEGDDGLPSPETYDRLVSDFLHTQDEGTRDRIADRLEVDSQSEHTVIRYYAVEAMSKLGREVFGSALLTATEDDNEAVRAIAVEALRR
ncbi:MAG: hypothetical protein IT384_30545 [Deltaproteobacteria bacterium]|nr:hypothetical protein [Deltaproteobacteria bacterium]